MNEIEVHEKFMREALVEARNAFAMGEIPIGAVIVKDGEVISRAHNLRHTTNIATYHAEMIAIEKANEILKNWRLTECQLYVTIEPCAMCAGAIYNSRIEKVIFGGFDYRGGACGTTIDVLSNPHINHKTEVISGILADEAISIMREFFASRRK